MTSSRSLTRRCPVAILSLLLLAPVAARAEGVASDSVAIHAVVADLDSAWARADAALWASHYAPRLAPACAVSPTRCRDRRRGHRGDRVPGAASRKPSDRARRAANPHASRPDPHGRRLGDRRHAEHRRGAETLSPSCSTW